MHTGLIISRHVAARAITAACRNGGHKVQAISTRQIDTEVCRNFEAVIVSNLPNTEILSTLMTSIPAGCQIIYISSWKIFPSRPQAVPWTENDFNVSEAAIQGECMSLVDRQAEYLLQVGGSTIYWTILRPAIVEGPFDSNPLHTRWFVERILAGGPVCLPDDDEQPYRHVSTRDLALAVLTVLGEERAHQRVLHVCADSVLIPSLHARFVAKALNKKADLHYISADCWEKAGLPRPMAGRNGAALIAPSPLLYELGWQASASESFLKNLVHEIASQPRRLDIHARARELELLHLPSVVLQSHAPVNFGWMLEADSSAGPSLSVTRLDTPSSGKWRTVALAVGEEVERTLSSVGVMGIKSRPVMPLLSECVQGGRSRTVLACTRNPRDRIDDGDDLIPVPSELGISALLAAPLARLLAVWPEDIPAGEVWILGRGVEALLAFWVASEQQQSAKIWSFSGETSAIENIKIEAIKAVPEGSPAIVVNVSGALESEAPLISCMDSASTLITPFIPLGPLHSQARLEILPNIPPQQFIIEALSLLLKWHNRLVNRRLMTCIPLQNTHRVFCVPALCLPVLIVKELE